MLKTTLDMIPMMSSFFIILPPVPIASVFTISYPQKNRNFFLAHFRKPCHGANFMVW